MKSIFGSGAKKYRVFPWNIASFRVYTRKVFQIAARNKSNERKNPRFQKSIKRKMFSESCNCMVLNVFPENKWKLKTWKNLNWISNKNWEKNYFVVVFFARVACWAKSYWKSNRTFMTFKKIFGDLYFFFHFISSFLTNLANNMRARQNHIWKI